MEQTPNLRLPYLMPAQAQKHVTHNEALRALDAVVQVGIIDRDLSTPPGGPADGARYIVAAGGTGAWAGQSGNIAAWQDGAWAFYAPASGWLAWVADEGRLLAWDGTAWVAAGGSSINPAAQVGINTTADTTNRLAVKSDAALFSHDDVTPGTGSIQVKYNKKLAGNTAAFLFQTNFSGRAEVGLTGDDNLHFKVSPDGSTWREALVVDRTTGRVTLDTGAPIVIVASGQSNMSRQETFSWTPPANLQIWNNALTDGSVGTAFAAPSSSVTSVSWAFAAEIARRNPHRQVRLINFSLAGQAIAQWAAGASAPDVYANLTANVTPALAALGVSKIDHFLWWQGESDTGNNTDLYAYAAKFETLVTRLIAESWFDPQTPVVIFGLSPSSVATGNPNYSVLNLSLQLLAASQPNVRTYVAPLSDAGYYVDTVHLTGAGQDVQGRTAAQVVSGNGGRRLLPNLALDERNGALVYSRRSVPLPVGSGSEVMHLSNPDGMVTRLTLDGYGAPCGFTARYANGTAAAPSAVLNGNILFNLSGFGWNGSAHVGGRAAIHMYATEDWTATANGANFRVSTTPNGTTNFTARFFVNHDGSVTPAVDNAQDCGTSSLRWANIWAANGTIQTSDARDKDVTGRIDSGKAAAAVDAIAPVMFRWKVGGYDIVPSATETEEVDGVMQPKMVAVPKPGKRLHAGFLAQEIKGAMDAAGVDFGVWGRDDVDNPDSRQWLRPDQIIPVLWAALRQTRAELAAVRSSISS